MKDAIYYELEEFLEAMDMQMPLTKEEKIAVGIKLDDKGEEIEEGNEESESIEDSTEEEEDDKNGNDNSNVPEKQPNFFRRLRREVQKVKRWEKREISRIKRSRLAVDRLKKKVEDSVHDEIIKLDVGGDIFPVAKETLLKIETTYFSGRFGGNFISGLDEDDGTYFIERDSHVFHHVLEILRGEPIPMDLLTKSEKEDLQDELDYYHIPNNAVKEPKEYESYASTKFIPGPNYTLSNGNKAVEKTGSIKWDLIAKGNKKHSKGKHTWQFKIIKTKGSNIMFGVAPHDIDQNINAQYTKSGYYMYVSGGTKYSGPPFSYSGTAYSKYIQGKAGDIVTMTLDCNKKTLSYKFNGEDMGVAYEGLKITKPLVMCVQFSQPTDKVELIKG